MAFFDKIKNAFHRTSEKISISLAGKKVDDNFVQEIEEALIMADLGVETAAELAKKISSRKFPRETTEFEVKQFLVSEICSLLKPYESRFFGENLLHNPEIILVIGVNGNGKTTTVAKIAHIFKTSGYKPLLVAADTFRAAAIDQLKYWSEKISTNIYIGKEGADVAGVVYDALKQASANANDLVLIDTAGRMQNRCDLLDELEKIKRVIKKLDESAPHKVVLVLDGLTGQSVHGQVDVFLRHIGVDGLIVTKLDGTAKGGAIVPLVLRYNLPVLAIGIGESLEDLRPFDAYLYTSALLGMPVGE
ncbi:MAG: signal recognition particle-docking protein FtsY [Holosporaceae bacterium]|nr:signal recognition particle-docking protein FtsY [Holosporaceae bacterium]